MTLLQDSMNYWCGCFSFFSLSITLYTFPGHYISEGVAVVQLLSHAQLFAIQTIACQTPLSFIISQSLLRFMSIESVMLSNHLILCHPLLLLSSIFPSTRVFSNESAFRIRWQSIETSASVFPMNIQSWFPLGLTGLISLKSKGVSRVFSSTTVWKHQFFSAQFSLWSSSHTHTWPLEKP